MEEFPPRPSGMHRATYQALEELDDMQSIVCVRFLNWLAEAEANIPEELLPHGTAGGRKRHGGTQSPSLPLRPRLESRSLYRGLCRSTFALRVPVASSHALVQKRAVRNLRQRHYGRIKWQQSKRRRCNSHLNNVRLASGTELICEESEGSIFGKSCHPHTAEEMRNIFRPLERA